jgi:Domain of unknown function (DUF4352)
MRISYLTLPFTLAVLSQTTCSLREAEAPAHIYQMGERVLLGHLIYTVLERQWMTQIGEGVDARVPQNRFYLIRISATNSGGSRAIVPTISLADDAGGVFSEIDNGDGIMDFIGALREIAPAETVQGNLAFDVQPKHYKLKLSDEDGKQTALVEIPLSFDPETPEVTSPLTDHSNDPTKK